MAPPAAPQKSNKNLEPEDVVQAIVLADSFNERFRPLTLDKPRCLLPLANKPLIEYTLELLAVAGVHEIFIVCCAHAVQVREYIANSRWSYGSPKVITLTFDARSAGDALRELDAKQVIKSDFILVSGDIVSNVKLAQVLEEHKARRREDKSCIMTMVVKRGGVKHRSRPRGEEAVFVLDARTNQCLHYEPTPLFPGTRKISLDVETVFEKQGSKEVVLRNDLIDCQIDICSPEVPPLFTENFDFGDLRTEFLKGILESDLLDRKVFCHILDSGYASRVRSTQLYDATSKDLIARWAFPIVPEPRYFRGCVYKSNVKLARSAILERNVVVGSGTEIGENTKINGSVVGDNCKIGDNVMITDSYIWPNSIIQSNCTIISSILAEHVTILKNTTINRGCLISYNVVLGPNLQVAAFSKITNRKPFRRQSDDDDEEGDESSHASFEYNVELVGEYGKGYLWEDDLRSSSSSESDIPCEDIRNLKISSIGYTMDEFAPPEYSDSDTESTSSEISEDLEAARLEIVQTIDRALLENHAVETAALELNTLKMALNITFRDLREVVIPKILALCIVQDPGTVFGKWSGLIQRFVADEDDQANVLEILLDATVDANHPDLNKQMHLVIVKLYKLDILEEDTILAWYEQEVNGEHRVIVEKLDAFVKWLKTAASDDSSSEDSE